MTIGPWGILAALFVARLGMGYQFQLVASTAPQLQPAFALSYTDIGSLIGLYMLPGLALAMPSGWLGARFGERRLVTIGLALMALGTAWCAMAPDFAQLGAGRLLAGFGAILMNVLMTKLVMDWFAKRNTVLAMAIFMNAWPAGVATALLVQAPMSAAYGWPAAFWSGALLAALGLAIFVIVHRPAPGAATQADGRWPIRAELPALLLCTSVWALYNIAFALMFGFGPWLLASQSGNVVSANALISMVMWIATVATPVGGLLMQRIDGGRFMVPAVMAVYAASLFVLAQISTSVPVLILMAIVAPSPAGAIMALPARILAPASRALGMGLFFTIFYIGMALGPAIAGWSIDITGDRSVPLIIAAALSLVSAVLFIATWRMVGARQP